MTIFLKSGGLSQFADVDLWPFTPRDVTFGGAPRLRRLWRWIAGTGHLARKALTQSRRRRAGLRALSRLSDRTLLDLGISRADVPGYMPGRIQGWRTPEPWR
jgi:uncharacterized protein YjiS (DUF1127 family)